MLRLLPLLLALGFAESSWAAPQVQVLGRSRKPGEVLLVTVTGHGHGRPPSGNFDAKPLAFFRGASSGTYLSFIGLDLDIATGTHALALDLAGLDGSTAAWREEIFVSTRAFKTVRLKVEQEYVTPGKEAAERAEKESKLLSDLWLVTGPEALFKGRFVTPIASASSSRFGERRVFNGVPKAPHSGADLRAKTGTPVRAPAGARVAFAGSLFYQGNTVILDHGLGLYSYYAHLSEILVKEGQVVARGELLGKVGATGRVTGPHLHWSVRLQDARVDPFSLTSLKLDDWLSLSASR